MPRVHPRISSSTKIKDAKIGSGNAAVDVFSTTSIEKRNKRQMHIDVESSWSPSQSAKETSDPAYISPTPQPTDYGWFVNDVEEEEQEENEDILVGDAPPFLPSSDSSKGAFSYSVSRATSDQWRPLSSRSLSPAWQHVQFWREKEVQKGGKAPSKQQETHLLTGSLSTPSKMCIMTREDPPPPLTYAISTKSFLTPTVKSGQMQYTIGIPAVRIAEKRGSRGHAEYQVAISNDEGIYVQWKRFTDFKVLAERAEKMLKGHSKQAEVWANLKKDMKLGRCLDPPYLRAKRLHLEYFLAQLMFELPEPDLLLDFVNEKPRKD